MELSLASDIRLVLDTATLCLPECSLAIFPGAGGTVTLPRLVGPGRAKELIFSSRRFSGLEALAYGIANHSYPSTTQLMAEAEELAAKIAANGPLGVRAAKNVINATLDQKMEDALDYSMRQRYQLNYTEDFKEALKAFEEKRKPKFTGK